MSVTKHEAKVLFLGQLLVFLISKMHLRFCFRKLILNNALIFLLLKVLLDNYLGTKKKNTKTAASHYPHVKNVCFWSVGMALSSPEKAKP